MKKTIYFIILCIFALFLCACATTSTTSDEYTGTITIALPAGNNNRQVYENAILEYNKIRPNVNVNIYYQGTDDFYETYLGSIIDKKPIADCAFIDHIYIQTLAQRNKIIPVTNDIENVKSSYIDGLVDLGLYNNEYYSYPFSANTICLFYNKEILCDRQVPTTYQEFLEVADSIYNSELQKDAGNRNQVFSLFTSSDSKSFGAFLFNSWVKREGGKIISDDLKNAYLDSDEVKDVLSKWQEIATSGYGDASSSTESLFYSGRVAFIEMGCWKIPDLLSGLNEGKYGVAPLFSLGDSGDTSSVLGLYSLCVTKGTDENKMNIASDFCKFLSTNKEVQLAYAKNTNLLPVTKEASEDEYFSSPEWQVFINSMSTAATRPATPAWPKIQTAIENMILNVMSGSITISDAQEAIQKTIENLLAQYNR